MVSGLQWILRGEKMSKGSAETQLLRAQFAESNDPDDRFIKDCCELGKSADFEVSKKAFKVAWKTWAAENDFSEKMVTGVNGAMRRICQRFGITNGRPGKFKGPRRWVYQGVRLKTEFKPTHNELENDQLNG